MVKPLSPLSFREMAVLRFLSQGKNYQQIRDLLNCARSTKGKEPSVSMDNVHSTCWTIRRKTGIRSTLDAHECRAVLRQRHSAIREGGPDKPHTPTPRQMTVLRMVAEGKSYQEIASALGLGNNGHQSAQNYASQGCRRIGLRVPAWQRTHAIRDWLAAYDAQLAQAQDPMDDPMF
jgi:DNA-binding CsgD family transcriptional regulator